MGKEDPKLMSFSGHRVPFVRIAIIVGFLLIGIVVIAMLNWKEIGSGIPAFDELQVAQANSFRPDYGASSIEFLDAEGCRFQTRAGSKSELNQIKAALDQQVPVCIRYGRWDSPFQSGKIFTVYQVEIEDTVIVPYERFALANQSLEKNKILIITAFVIISIAAIYVGVRLGLRACSVEPVEGRSAIQ